MGAVCLDGKQQFCGIITKRILMKQVFLNYVRLLLLPAMILLMRPAAKADPAAIAVHVTPSAILTNSGPGPHDPPTADCIGPVEWTGQLLEQSKDGIADGTDIHVGFFVMKNTKFSKKIGGYSGTGEILVNFVNRKVLVEFTDIQINKDNRMFSGKITGKVTSNTVIDQGMSQVKTGMLEKVPDMDALMGYLEQGVRKVNTLDPDKLPVEMDLPLSFDKNDFNIGIVGMIFEAKQAFINAVLNTQIPGVFGNDYLLLAAKGVPFHPNGYGGKVQVALAKDQLLTLSKDKLQMEIKAGKDVTFATFDCNGFKDITITGALVLDRKVALPYDAAAKPVNDPATKVKMQFKLDAAAGYDDFILQDLTFSHAFAIPQASDFIFKADKASFDLSASKKISGINEAYPDINNDWIGVQVKTLSLTLPEAFKKDGGRITLAVNNMLISKMGVRGNFSVAGDPLAAGAIAGWGFTLQKAGLTINNNVLSGGMLAGRIRLPLGQAAEVGFTGAIAQGDANGAKVTLGLITQNDINVDLFLAKMDIEPGSNIKLTKSAGKYEISAALNGALGISFNNNKKGNVSNFEMPQLTFENLVIKGKDGSDVPEFGVDYIGLQNINEQQASMGGFELNVGDIAFKKDNGTQRAGLQIGLGISLFGGSGDTKNGAGAYTKFTLWAKPENGKYVFDQVQLNKIAVNAELGVAKVTGDIEVFSKDTVYGNGFRGKVNANMKGLGAEIGVTLQFGKTLDKQGTPAFKYWYFDAMAEFQTGLNIPGTIASIYGFGGGAWCNMSRKGDTAALKPGSFKKQGEGTDAAHTESGAVFVPSKSDAGFFAAVMFGLTGSKNAFNGDLKFTMEFDAEKQSVNYVELAGKAYLMQNPSNLAKRDPEKAFLYCDAHIKYEAPGNMLSGDFGAQLNIVNVVKGSGKVSFMFDMPDKDDNGHIINPNEKTMWFIKVGQWTPNKDPFNDPARLQAQIGFDAKVAKVNILFQTYFMLGNAIGKTMPPMPDYIYELVKGEGMEKAQEMPFAVQDTTGMGIAFGAGLKLTAGFDFFVLSANLEAAAGFDVLIADLNTTCDGKPAGFEGWYAQAQAYAYLRGDMALFRKIPLAEFVAGAVFQAKLPNPNWVRGDIFVYIDILKFDAGTYHGKFEKGELCKNMETDYDPFENAKLIKSVTPVKGTKNVSPFVDNITVNFLFNPFPYNQVNIFNAEHQQMMTYTYTTKMTLLDKQGKEVPLKAYFIDGVGDGRRQRLVPEQTLLPNHQYTFKVSAQLTRYQQFGESYDKKDSVIVTFTTGNLPQELSTGHLAAAYPAINQRFFMKQNADGEPGQGFLEFKMKVDYLLAETPYYIQGKVAGGFRPFVRFHNVATKQNIDVAVTKKDGQIGVRPVTRLVFDIPQELKNSTIYELKLIRKLVPYSNIILPSIEPLVMDRLHFRTSKYNNLPDKMKKLKLAKMGYLYKTRGYDLYNFDLHGYDHFGEYHIPILFLEADEPFDQYELYGYSTSVANSARIVPSMVNATNFTGIGWLYNCGLKYYDLNTPALSAAEKQYIHNNSDVAYHVEREPGFPHEGVVRPPFSANAGTMYWMKKYAFYEKYMRWNKFIGADETIARPAAPLSAQEISNAKAGGLKGNIDFISIAPKKGGGGLISPVSTDFANAPDPKAYWALMDFTQDIGFMDKEYTDLSRYASQNDPAKLLKVFNYIKKLGWPTYSNGQQKILLNAATPVAGGSSTRFVKEFYYNHDPKPLMP